MNARLLFSEDNLIGMEYSQANHVKSTIFCSENQIARGSLQLLQYKPTYG